MRDYADQLLDIHIAEEDAYEEACPTCEKCGNKITFDDYFYDFDGVYMCPDCFEEYCNDNFRKSIDKYIEERKEEYE